MIYILRHYDYRSKDIPKWTLDRDHHLFDRSLWIQKKKRTLHQHLLSYFRSITFHLNLSWWKSHTFMFPSRHLDLYLYLVLSNLFIYIFFQTFFNIRFFRSFQLMPSFRHFSVSGSSGTFQFCLTNFFFYRGFLSLEPADLSFFNWTLGSFILFQSVCSSGTSTLDGKFSAGERIW